VGYRGVALPGLPFDERRGVIANEQGRVSEQPRVYTAGWIKRGPSGVIGTNKKDAAETCERLLEDAAAGLLEAEGGELEELLRGRGLDFVEYAGWQAIDEHGRLARKGTRTRLGRVTEELWGGETRKAIDNFPVSGEPIPLHVARWLGRIKAAAARVNAELGLLDAAKAERIAAAADRIAN